MSTLLLFLLIRSLQILRSSAYSFAVLCSPLRLMFVWKYADTSENPADLSKRCLNAQSLTESSWLTVSLKTQTSKRHGIGADRFSRFSSLHSLQRAIESLILVIKEFKRRKSNSQEKIDSKLWSNKNTHLFAAANGKGTSGGHQNHNSNFTERKLFRRIESRLSLIVRVNVLLNGTVVVDSDWRFLQPVW